jgi:hypothetical protein
MVFLVILLVAGAGENFLRHGGMLKKKRGKYPLEFSERLLASIRGDRLNIRGSYRPRTLASKFFAGRRSPPIRPSSDDRATALFQTQAVRQRPQSLTPARWSQFRWSFRGLSGRHPTWTVANESSSVLEYRRACGSLPVCPQFPSFPPLTAVQME